MLQLITGGANGNGGLERVVDDPTPALGGDLDGGGFNISNVDTGTFVAVDCTDEDTGYQIDGTSVLWTGVVANQNIFLGSGAFDKDEGTGNVGIGYQAGFNNTFSGSYGTSNLYLGYKAGYGLHGNNRGYDNVYIGFYAGYETTLGHHNMAIGNRAGMELENGHRNMLLGYYAGKKISSGDDNICIGMSTGILLTTQNSNTFIGSYAGYVTTGSSNIFIGYKSGYNQGAISNILFIDNQDRLSAANELTKALIYGVFAAAPADQDLTFNANVFLTQIKSGATQVAAGAAVNEVWKTNGHTSLPDNVLMIGV